MPLPTDRNTTYSAGTPIKSADLNDIQDQIIALNQGAHGSQALPITPMGEYTNASFDDSGGYVAATSGGAMAEVKIDGLRPGDRIKSLEFWAWGSGAGSLTTVRLYRFSSAGRSEVGNLSDADVGAAWNQAAGNIGPYTVQAGESFMFTIELSVAGDRCLCPTVYYDRPAS